MVYPKYYLKEIVDMFCEFHSRENKKKDIHEFIGGIEKKKILEVGAGTGRYSIALARKDMKWMHWNILRTIWKL